MPLGQIFMPWEGVAAERAGIQLNVFKLGDYQIPYCYSPVLAAHPDTLSQNPSLVKAFLAATAKGYQFAAQHPAEAAEVLCSEVAADVARQGKPQPEPLDAGMVAASQQIISQHYLESSSNAWGRCVPIRGLFRGGRRASYCLPLGCLLLSYTHPGQCLCVCFGEQGDAAACRPF